MDQTTTKENPLPPKKKARTSKKEANEANGSSQTSHTVTTFDEGEPALVRSLRQLDPLLQFLTRRSGKLTFPLSTLRSILPAGYDANQILDHLVQLNHRGIICLFQVEGTALSANVNESSCCDGNLPPLATRVSTAITSLTWNSPFHAGFPPPPSMADRDFPERQKMLKKIGSLHGTTKTAAQRRLRALQYSLKEHPDSLITNRAKANDVLLDIVPAVAAQRSELDSLAHSRSNLSPHPVTPSAAESPSSLESLTGATEHSSNVRLCQNSCNAETEIEKGDIGQSANSASQSELEARNAFKALFRLDDHDNSKTFSCPEKDTLTCILPKQISYAGSHPSRSCQFANLSARVEQSIPLELMRAFGMERSCRNDVASTSKIDEDSAESCSKRQSRQLYSHQVVAIESAMNRNHTLICTGTGSGKSLCFWLPVLSAAYASSLKTSLHSSSMTASCGGGVSFLIFPTKALAQDQLSQLKRVLASNADLERHIRPATLDGDTPHSSRVEIAENCNVILTNPDTIHSAILPNWNTLYKDVLGRLEFVVLDEAHVYQGVFGAQVALVLARLHRICVVASHRRHQDSRGKQRDIVSRSSSVQLPRLHPTYLACSATMNYPEHQFRQLFPISTDESVVVLTAEQDGSPRSPKHFFVWNPPILDMNGLNINQVTIPPKSASAQAQLPPVVRRNSRRKYRPGNRRSLLYVKDALNGEGVDVTLEVGTGAPTTTSLHRRHAAEETALLLARLVTLGVRCIAFCKTRMVVEWVYERTVSVLRSDSSSAQLATKVESYRGGYNTMERRLIEQRLFTNEVLGVVATCALEVGVDIGGIDVTLHCGFPTSYASLFQQAGRAGRGVARLHVPSVAVMVCFNSPAEQHIWQHPTRLLKQAVPCLPSLPCNLGIVQRHILCASKESPLTGTFPLTVLQETAEVGLESPLWCDCELFGSKPIYEEALQTLLDTGSVFEERVSVTLKQHGVISIFRAHPSACNPWMRVSLRSVEPVNYSVVDISHPSQGGRTDCIHDERAVMDQLPYSRVFYHAFPGAVITHRGKRYLVLSMTRPPVISTSLSGSSACNLAAYAKPTTARYITRPLSTLQFTIVKQVERLDLGCSKGSLSGLETTMSTELSPKHSSLAFSRVSFAGCGVMNVKRNVHGFKKLSLATLAELSRTEISMPPMEFDTFGIWIDVDASNMSSTLIDYGSGVHALSHALIAVSPLLVDCSLCDLECEHAYFDPTRIVLFDDRPGGIGICAQLWKCLFVSNGLLDSAIELLESCTTCSVDKSYKGGCPACIQCIKCTKFNLHLSKQAGLEIAKRMKQRLVESGLHGIDTRPTIQSYAPTAASPDRVKKKTGKSITPRRKARAKALDLAKDIHSSRDRSIVVGRPEWPFEDGGGLGKQEKPE